MHAGVEVLILETGKAEVLVEQVAPVEGAAGSEVEVVIVLAAGEESVAEVEANAAGVEANAAEVGANAAEVGANTAGVEANTAAASVVTRM